MQKWKLRSGGFGIIYKRSFQRGDNVTLLAKKHIHYKSKHTKTILLIEISNLGQIQHGKVLQLQSWCHQKDGLLLVYDYMNNGGVNEWLNDSSCVAVMNVEECFY